MKDSRGFAKYEIVTVLLLMICVFVFLFYVLLGGLSTQKINTMKESALNFSKVVATNIASFHNLNTIYLGEAIDEKVIGNIKSPVSSGDCDISESKIHISNGEPIITFRCGNYLLDEVKATEIDKAELYEVGEWTTEKITGGEEKVLYNCLKNGKEIYPNYYEELYFISLLNKDNNTNYYFAKDVKGTCDVVSKTFYRVKEKYKK